jgi:hypothetical protein
VLTTQDERTAVAVETIHGIQRLQSGWPRFLLGWAAAFQITAALVLALFPYGQILTPGTEPVLELASRYVWSALFAVAGLLTALTPLMRPVVRATAWVCVNGLGGMWLTAFAANVAKGGGSALGIVGWFFLYVPIVAVALHQSLGKR